jgi:adenylate cyclase
MGEDEVGTLRRLTACRAILDGRIAAYRGRIFGSAGDSVVADFVSVLDAVQCAVAVQESLAKDSATRPAGEQMRLRIGVHVGDVIVQGENLFGDGVNIAARLEALAEPGGICISGAVRDQIGTKLPLAFTDLGERQVKNIAQPLRAYRVGGETDAVAGAPPPPLPDKTSIAVLPFANMSGDPFEEGGEQGVKDTARPVRAYAMGAAAAASTPLVAALAQPGSTRPRRAIIAASTAAAIGVAVVAWWAWPQGNSPTVSVQRPAEASPQIPPVVASTPAPRLSIVVLPFANLSSDPDQEYFADGITDDLTTDLSRISGSFVIARTTASTYKGKSVDVKQIGHDLGVRYVIEGSVRRVGDRAQVNVQLIDAESGAHLWADRFEADRRNLAEAQREIIGRLAGTLNLALVEAAGQRIEQERAIDPDARDLLVRGWALWYRPFSLANHQEAERAFERALEIDPRSVDARIGVATILVTNVSAGMSRSVEQDQARAERLLLEAIESDADSSQAHEVMGILRKVQNRLDESRNEFETAIKLDRNNGHAILQLGQALMFLGRPEAGIPYIENVMRLLPGDSAFVDWALGSCHLMLGHVDEASDLLRKARAGNPRIYFFHLYLAGALGLRGDLDEAKAALAEAIKLKPEVNSQAQWRAIQPWITNPQQWALREKTLNIGLRRAGFPDG